jgi:hypothetical protein
VINELTEIKNKTVFLKKDKNGREICIYELDNCSLVGTSCYYPNTLLYCTNTHETFNPIREKIMSLNSAATLLKTSSVPDTVQYEDCPVFFFVYNTDNYFHFLYDTLPYLISYKHLKSKINNLKLLMNFPTPEKHEFYNFVIEFLFLLDITKDDILIANQKTQYKKIYISTSYTHDIDSNLPPREEIYELYNSIVDIVNRKYPINEHIPNVYISRRTWIHNNLSNIGTNYTTRRKLVNEDNLVRALVKKGYKEIFAETLTTIEKILIFSNAKKIVGAIGGGIANALFAKPETELFVLISPTFMDKHKRFNYCFKNKKTTFFDKSVHVEKSVWKKYMRVKVNTQNIIGEIEKVNSRTIDVLHTEHNVAGWNSQMKLKRTKYLKKDCIRLDDGLNCAWKIDLSQLNRLI